MTDKPKTKFDLKVALFFIPAAYLSYLFHEFGHWIIGVIQGHQMSFSLVGVWPDSGQNISETDINDLLKKTLNKMVYF